MNIPYQKRLSNLSSLIGNTPLLEITLSYKQKIRRIFAKAEHMNMTGSIKDRMAFHIIENAYEKGDYSRQTRETKASFRAWN